MRFIWRDYALCISTGVVTTGIDVLGDLRLSESIIGNGAVVYDGIDETTTRDIIIDDTLPENFPRNSCPVWECMKTV